MLILSRRIGETLKIGDNMAVAVLGIRGNRVRIGTESPREVRVDRSEIAKSKRADAVAVQPRPM